MLHIEMRIHRANDKQPAFPELNGKSGFDVTIDGGAVLEHGTVSKKTSLMLHGMVKTINPIRAGEELLVSFQLTAVQFRQIAIVLEAAEKQFNLDTN